MADDPFCPLVNCSSASSTSVRCRWRTSTAIRSIEEAMIDSTQKYSAWRSRGMTWLDTGSGLRPILPQTYSSTNGSILAKVPTAPEMAPVALHLGMEGSQLQPEGNRLGMDTVGAPHTDRVLVFHGPYLE